MQPPELRWGGGAPPPTTATRARTEPTAHARARRVAPRPDRARTDFISPQLAASGFSPAAVGMSVTIFITIKARVQFS